MPFNFVLMTNNLNHEKYLRDRLSELGLSEIDVHQEDYISQLDTKILYLSEDPEKAEKAIKNGHAAAIMFPNDTNNKGDKSSVEKELRVAFDGDNVLFSQDPESAKAIHGLESFKQNEDEKQDVPLREGPLKCFLEALVNMEKKFHAKHPNENFPVQTFLVTARNPVISGTRVLKTLKSWGLELTQAFFLSGTPKGPPLSMIQPHIFFDDRKMHVNEGLELGVVSALVPYGIGYETDKEAKEEEANHGDKQGNSVSIN
ncbi:hypothetical protein COCON_G00002070 [Conger conger]|uniref:5'-nucleotidase n=1 Tax=Conger conger TaxID=82655 RepID=A0A9Q1I8C2_CONCO|nr:hypothetical protein COCON_G00002070 [Conger conger]